MSDLEDNEFVASEHDILVSAVSKLDKTQHITEPTRNEPTITSSEFNLIKRSNKISLSDVAKVLEDSSDLRKISKKLKKSQEANKVLSKPLEKPQAQRIKRSTGYEVTKKRVGRWDPVVARSRTAEFTAFPLKHVETKLQPTNEFLARLELKSDLERELEVVDPPPLIEEEEEEEKIYPMSYEEMVEHRQHLAKLRAQQSYKEAKAKRQSKIKSKKFHRVLKKERLKQQLKEFEELQKTDPEEALKKLEAIEKARALERHTLRHKNTGKWAKNKLIRAKYDKDVRQQLADQLAVSRGLTKKTQDVESSDDDVDQNEDKEDAPLTQDPMNPWMLKQSDKSNVNSEFDFGYKKYLKDKKMFKRKEASESESDTEDKNLSSIENNMTSVDLMILKESVKTLAEKASSYGHEITDKENSKETMIDFPTKLSTKTQLKKTQTNKIDTIVENTEHQEKFKTNDSNVVTKASKTKNKQKLLKTNVPVATSGWVVEEIENNTEKKNIKPVDISAEFETLENKVANKVEKKLKALRQQIEMIEKSSKNTSNKEKKKKKEKKQESEEIDTLEYLKFKNNKQKAIIDEELIETDSQSRNEKQDSDIAAHTKVLNAAASKPQETETSVSNIDPNRFIEVKPKYLNTSLSKGDGEADLLDDDDDEQVVPRVNIEDVFEEDDVIASFRKEKEDEINKDKPEDVDLSLPGWGSWGGKGVKAPKRKKNRFILKAPPKMPRRDDNKGDVIIKEFKDPKLAVHKVKDLPFPFTSVKDYEASIRAPLGNTFIPEKAHKKLIRPSIITKAGAIIEPMDEEELLVKKHRNFKNEKVLKMLGQK